MTKFPSRNSIYQMISEAAALYRGRDALVIRRRIRRETVTYEELHEYVLKCRAFFAKEHIKPDDRILLWGVNGPEYAVLLAACFSFGPVAVPVDYRTGPAIVAAIAQKTNPKAVFVSHAIRHDFLREKYKTVYFIEDLFTILSSFKAGRLSYESFPKNHTERLAEIVFTSGTTGVPKGVMLTEKNILSDLKCLDGQLPDLENGRILSILPLSHMFEQIIGFLLPLEVGATVYYLSRINSFRLMAAFQDYKPTHQLVVPQILKILWEKIEDKAKETGRSQSLSLLLHYAKYLPRPVRRLLFRDILKKFGGHLTLFASGGAPLEYQTGRHWSDIGITVIEGYGATEVTAAATMNPIRGIKLGSVGKPLPGVSVTIDENREIHIDSPSRSKGYYNDPENTKKSFDGRGFKMGDIGDFDGQGYLHIRGRDAFKIVLSSGEKVYVEDIETIVKQDTRVKDVCVLSKRAGKADEIHAYFILKSKEKPDVRSVVADINRKLESKQQIQSYGLWNDDDFPRTYTMKLDRNRISAVLNSVKDKKAAPQVSPKKDIEDIMDIVSNVSGRKKETIRDTDLLTTDLGLDSLSRVEIVSQVEEHLGLIVDETKIDASTTVKNLKDIVSRSEVSEPVRLPVWQFTRWGQFIHRWVSQIFLFPLHGFIIKIAYPQSKVPRIKPGTIVIANHPGVLDAATVLRVLARQGRTRIVSDVTSSVWDRKTKFMRMLELFMGAVPLYESGNRFLSVLQLNSDLLDKGYNLFFAPQGRIQRQDKEDPFLPGIGYIVRELDRPIHIVKIIGYRDIWPGPAENLIDSNFKRMLPKKRGTVQVVISEEIKKDWSKMSVPEVAKYLEEIYHNM